jgi:uncharacterized RDD family membrane protein YckC
MLCPQCGKSLACEKVTLCEQCERVSGVSPEESEKQLENDSDSEIGFNHEPLAEDIDSSDDFGNAGFWIRVVASITDGACIQLIIVATILLMTSLTSAGALLSAYFESMSPMLMLFGFLSTIIIFLVLLLIITFFYYPLFEISPLRATPGKYILGLEVCRDDNRKVGFFVAILRHFLRYIGYLLFFIGPLMCAFSTEKLALHDLLTNTKTRKRERKSIAWILSVFCLSIGMSIGLSLMYDPESDITDDYNFSRSGEDFLKQYESDKSQRNGKEKIPLNSALEERTQSSVNKEVASESPSTITTEQSPTLSSQDNTNKNEIKKNVVQETKSEEHEDDIYSLSEFERARLLRQRMESGKLN